MCNGRFLPAGLSAGILLCGFILRRLKVSGIEHCRIAVPADVAGIFQQAFHLVLVPSWRINTVWDVLLIQRIGDVLVGRTCIIEGKHHADDPLFLRHDLQRTVPDLIPI